MKTKISKNKDHIQRTIVTSSLKTTRNVHQFIKKYSDDSEAKREWLKAKPLETVYIAQKFNTDHIAENTSTKLAKDKYNKRDTNASTIIDINEDLANKVRLSNDSTADIFANKQQLSVKLDLDYGAKTINRGKTQERINSIVVKGNWTPETGTMEVYHYDGETLNTDNRMMPEYMWMDDSKTPKHQKPLYELLKREMISKELFTIGFNSNDEIYLHLNRLENKEFALLCYKKAIISTIENSTGKRYLKFMDYHELF